MNNQFPENEYKRTTFSFTAGELREVCGFDTAVKIGDMAKILISNYINATALKRIGVRNSPDVGIQYNIEKGTFDVYEPKNWCSKCQTAKATFKYLEKPYCQTCIEILKKEAIKKEVKGKEGKK